MRCWLNGDLIPIERAAVSVQDRGFLYGDTLFETLRIRRGAPVLLDAHLQRLLDGMRTLGFGSTHSPQTLRHAAMELPRAESVREGVLRITLSRGCSARGALPIDVHSPTLLMTVGPLPPTLQRRQLHGVVLKTSPWRRPSPSMLPNSAKTGNYLGSVLAMQSIVDSGADEALVLGANGDVAECSSSNLFAVIDGTVVTPWLGSGALAGVTRAFVLQLARTQGVDASERRLMPDALHCADELFITSAVAGIVPVAALDGRRWPVAGTVTRTLMQAYEAAIDNESAIGSERPDNARNEAR